MPFNLKKSKIKTAQTTAAEPNMPYSKMLDSYNKEYGNTIDGKGESVPSTEGLLDSARNNEISGETQEMRLDSVRDSKVDPQTLEAAIDEHDGIYRRQFDGQEKFQVHPRDALAEAIDRKYRDAFAAADDKAGDTAFWDKFVGDQMTGEPTKVLNNVPVSGTQLQNAPDRFGKIEGVPHREDHEKNVNNVGKALDIDPMMGYSGKEKAVRMAVAAINKADRDLFSVYFKAAREKRALTKAEASFVEAVTDHKRNVLGQMLGLDDTAADPLASTVNPQEAQPAAAAPQAGVLPHPDEVFPLTNDAAEAPLPSEGSHVGPQAV